MPKATMPEATENVIALRRLEDEVLIVEIEGKTPVIPHKWSEKAIRMMADKQAQRGVRTKHAPKNPEQEAQDSCYWLGTSPAVPSVAFKASMVGACRFFEEPSMVMAKLLLYVEGEGPDQLVRIAGDKTLRTDTPRNSNGVADLRYRYSFFPWSATLRIHFVPNVINRESVLALLDAGGRGGVGDWRPSAPKSLTGTFGQFRVKES